jgi:xanthine/uracil permease
MRQSVFWAIGVLINVAVIACYGLDSAAIPQLILAGVGCLMFGISLERGA